MKNQFLCPNIPSPPGSPSPPIKPIHLIINNVMTTKSIIISILLTLACAFPALAQDADSLYAKDLLQPGTQAPDFTLAAPDGTRHSLSSMRGSYVVLDFWASWCPDCRKDTPMLKELYTKYGQNIKFVSVSFDDDKAKWTNYIEANGMDWLNLSELKKWKQTEISKQYNIQWIPAMYLIDRQGQIILSTVMIEKLAAKLKELHEL